MGLFEKLVSAAEEVAEKTTKAVGDAVEAVKQGETGEYIDAAKKKASEAVEAGKKKVEEIKLSNELEKAKTALGSLVYIMYKTGEKNEELIEQYINDVAQIEEKLEALKETSEDATVEDFKEAVAEETTEAEEIVLEAEEVVLETEETVAEAEENKAEGDAEI